MMKAIRLDKYLSELGTGSRSQVKEMIRKGQVTVNGQVARQPERKVNPVCDTVTVGDRELNYRKYRYLMLNKPAGYVSATRDSREKTVLQLLPAELAKDLFPVGRLDKDTEGLLLLTNDGDLAHRLLSPRKHVDKVYEAVVEGRMTENDREAFQKGMMIGDEKPTLPAVLVILSAEDAYSRVLVTIREGRFHQIKRMFLARGSKVIHLKRIGMGGLQLDETLQPGQYRELTGKEKTLLGIADPEAGDAIC